MAYACLWDMLQRYLQSFGNRLLALRARLIIPALKQQHILSRDREDSPPFVKIFVNYFSREF
jgi:hypothetical protein